MTRESLVIAICALLLGVASPPAEASIGDRDDVRRRKAAADQTGPRRHAPPPAGFGFL